MHLTDLLLNPGEHAFSFPGAIGSLEAVLTVPETSNTDYVAILGHPHSLQGGSMTNKVVTTLVRVFKELNIPSIRFNFRGVGASFGTYDAGVGESDDMLLFANNWLETLPSTKIIFAGFSFGSYVAYRAAAQCAHAMLITIAPPVHHYDYTEFSPKPAPWIIPHGELDEVVPMSIIQEFVERDKCLELITFPETTHFFHGKLILLKQCLMDAIRAHDIN